MGTRNLICVVYDNEYKIAQYSQWDGYFSGQGKTIINFLRQDFNREAFIKNLDTVIYVPDEEVNALWKKMGADEQGFVGIDGDDKFLKTYPSLHRNCGAEILHLIQNNSGVMHHKDLEFAGNGLFCEYCYVVNLDNNSLEVFTGFHKEPLGPEERFSFLNHLSENGYYPVKRLAIIHFSALSDKTVSKLEKLHEKEE